MNDLFSHLYEFLTGYLYSFSEALLKHGMYSTLGIIAFISSLVFAFVYYYIIDHPRFNRWFHWLLIAGVLFLINLLIAYFLVKGKMEYEGLTFKSEYMTISVWHAVITVLFFIVFSYIIRWWSKNCASTPIPL